MGLPLVEQNTAVPRVCLIITAWNQVAKTVACLETVFALAYAPKALEVVLIDNGSQPELAIAVKQQFPHLTYMRHEQNRGFAGGYNSGLRYALTHSFDYICLLNNDTLVAPDMLSHLVEAAQAEPSWGVVSAKVYYADDRQRIWTVGERVSPLVLDLTSRYQNQVDEGQWETRQTMDFVPFCAVLLSRVALERVGLLDEGFFVYYEDMDYCRRVLGAGLQIGLEPAAHVWHAVSSSSGGQWSPLYGWWIGQSSGRYFRKHGRGWRLLLIVPFKLFSAGRNMVRLGWRRQWRTMVAYGRGLWVGWVHGRGNVPPPTWVHPTNS